MASKKEMRIIMRDRRDQYSTLLRSLHSDHIIRNITRWEQYKQALCILAYAPMRSEVDIWPLVEMGLKEGKKMFLPVVRGDDLVVVRVQEDSFYRISPFGVREPVGEEYPPELLDLVLVPGLAFDPRGYRIGYGKGYYDRFLPKTRCTNCGIGFRMQFCDDALHQEHDVPLDYIIAEDGLHKAIQ